MPGDEKGSAFSEHGFDDTHVIEGPEFVVAEPPSEPGVVFSSSLRCPYPLSVSQPVGALCSGRGFAGRPLRSTLFVAAADAVVSVVWAHPVATVVPCLRFLSICAAALCGRLHWRVPGTWRSPRPFSQSTVFVSAEKVDSLHVLPVMHALDHHFWRWVSGPPLSSGGSMPLG